MPKSGTRQVKFNEEDLTIGGNLYVSGALTVDGATSIPALATSADVISAFNVKNTIYAGGAKGDNATDDTAAIQAAVNAAAAAGGVVFVPHGTYLVTHIDIPNTGDVKIFGEGITSILKHKDASQDRCIIYHESFAGSTPAAGSVWIEGIRFLGAGQGVAAGGNNQRGAIWLDYIQGDITINDCVVTDFRDVGINLWPAGKARVERNRLERIGATSSGWNVINYDNVRTQTSATSGSFWIKDNYLNGCPNGGICASFNSPTTPTQQIRAVVSGNEVHDMAWVGIAVETSYSQDVVIHNNQVYNCWVGIELGTGGNTQFSTPQPNYNIVAGNLIDSQFRTTGVGATAACIAALGSRNLIEANICRAYRAGILVDRSDTDSFADDVIVSGNMVEYGANVDSSIVDIGISVAHAKACQVDNNNVHRMKTYVKGAQVVGAGGTLNVGTVEGLPSSGSLTINGSVTSVQNYTAITQAGIASFATITLVTGGTFADGDLVMFGGCGNGINVSATSTDCSVDGNIVRNAGKAGVVTSGSTNTDIRNNKVVSPWSQNVAGTKCGLLLTGSGTDCRVYQNEVYDLNTTVNATIGYQVDGGETRPSFLNNYAHGFATAYNANVAPVVDRGNRKSNTQVPNGGLFSSTPGAVATLNIAHGLMGTPTLVSVQPSNVNARGAPLYSITTTATNIVLTFAANLTAATVYDWNWTAQV